MICPICFEHYKRNVNVPVRLPCNHIVCLDCLEMYQKSDLVKCPACMELTFHVADVIQNNRPEEFFELFESKSSKEEGNIKVMIRTPDAGNFFVYIRPGENIVSVKQILLRNNGLKVESQVILFNGSLLNDNKRLDQVGVKDGDVLFLVNWMNKKKKGVKS